MNGQGNGLIVMDKLHLVMKTMPVLHRASQSKLPILRGGSSRHCGCLRGR